LPKKKGGMRRRHWEEVGESRSGLAAYHVSRQKRREKAHDRMVLAKTIIQAVKSSESDANLRKNGE